MRKIVAVIILTLFGNCVISAQSEYSLFRDTATLLPGDKNTLTLEFSNLNYLRNYEYFNKITTGYTLFGYQLSPQIRFQPHENVEIKGGIFLRHEFGINRFTQVEPLFTLKLQKKGYSFLIGNIEGATSHRLIEPVKDIESIIVNRPEQGLQVLADKKFLWFDFFIDWEKAIINKSASREEFTTGISARVKAINSEKTKLELPLQLVSMHKGGQIDTSGLPGETIFNAAGGISFTRKIDSRFLDGIRTEHYFAFYRDASHQKRQAFVEGRGYYSSVTFMTKYFDLDIRYWKGNKFIAPKGAPLFSSVSYKIPGYTEEDRHLLFINFIYNRAISKNIAIDARFEPYYDCNVDKLEYAYGIFIRFKHDFFLTKIRARE